MKEIIHSRETALIFIKITTCIHVTKFQSVSVWDVRVSPIDMNYKIRHATDKDREDLTDIFNYYIEKSHAAFFDKKSIPCLL